MKLRSKLGCLLLLISCGKLVDVQVPSKIKIGPDYESASDFCDRRYGYKTEESESCFLDYRNYFKVLSAGPTITVEQFCSQYTDPVQKAACEDNLNSNIL